MPDSAITRMLQDYRGERDMMVNKLMPVIYDQLKLIAHRYIIRERRDHTLNTTGLVHEAYMKLLKQHVEYQNRAHLYAIVATTMRRILLEAARAKNTLKRGEGAHKIPLEEHFVISDSDADQLITINTALERLEVIDERLARIVELRYFGGMNSKEIAAAMDCSESTVKRGWRTAKAWLYDTLKAH